MPVAGGLGKSPLLVPRALAGEAAAGAPGVGTGDAVPITAGAMALVVVVAATVSGACVGVAVATVSAGVVAAALGGVGPAGVAVAGVADGFVATVGVAVAVGELVAPLTVVAAATVGVAVLVAVAVGEAVAVGVAVLVGMALAEATPLVTITLPSTAATLAIVPAVPPLLPASCCAVMWSVLVPAEAPLHETLKSVQLVPPPQPAPSWNAATCRDPTVLSMVDVKVVHPGGTVMPVAVAVAAA